MATSPEQVEAPVEARDVRPYDEPERLRKHHVTRCAGKPCMWASAATLFALMFIDAAENDGYRRRTMKVLGDAALEERAQWILMHRERVVERKEIIELG